MSELPKKIGFGRAISDESLESLTHIFSSVFPSEVHFSSSQMPGISYIPAANLLRASQEHHGNIDNSQLVELMGLYVLSLCDDGKLDSETALLATEVPLQLVRYKKDGSNSLQLYLRDKKNGFYKDRFIIQGERNIIRSELGAGIAPKTYSNTVPPASILKLGELQGETELVTNPMLDDVIRASGNISLQAIGPVSF